MKGSELKNKDAKELEKLLKEKGEELRDLHFDLVSGKTKNVKDVKAVRKDIARLLTAINSLKV